MRLIDISKFLLVPILAMAADLVLVFLPALNERCGGILDYSTIWIPLVDYSIATASLPAMQRFRPMTRWSIVSITAITATIPTLVALLFYGLSLRGGQLTD